MRRTIYAYSTKSHYDYRIDHGDLPYLKIGDTTRFAEDRVHEQDNVANPEKLIIKKEWEIPFKYRDYDIHKILRKMGVNRIRKNREWFECNIDVVDKAINKLIYGISRSNSFKMREEQSQAVEKAYNYFMGGGKEFLFNAKMRFGKTFASYQLMKKLDMKKILILTYKPQVVDAWKSDLNNHVDFEDYKFYHALDFTKNNPINIKKSHSVLFGSFQDILGKNCDGTIKKKWQKAIKDDYDLIIIDEVHFGFEKPKAQAIINKLSYNHLLVMSGTPIKLLLNGGYDEDQIFTWSYIDEQKKRQNEEKNNWKSNIYRWLPPMKLYGYSIGQEVNELLDYYKEDEYLTLNKFFSSDNGVKLNNAKAVEKWLDILASKSPRQFNSPFNNNKFAEKLRHIFWYLSGVKHVKALAKMLRKHWYFKDYTIIIAADDNDGEDKDTLNLVRNAIANNEKTITLSCGKLNTGVTIPEWDGIFMLSDTSAPENYWQTIFRVQSQNEKDKKNECFVFDFNPNRTLEMVYSYAENLAKTDQRTTDSIREFLDVMPIYLYEDNKLVKINFNKVIEKGIPIKNAIDKWSSKTVVDALSFNEFILLFLSEFKSMKNEKINQKITESELKNGKTYVQNKNENNQKNKKDGLNQIIKKALTITKLLPTFIFLSENKEESINDVLNTNEADLFKNVVGITINQFKEMIEAGFLRKNVLDRSIQALYLAELNKSPQDILMHLYSPSNQEIYTPLSLVKDILNKLPEEVWSDPTLRWLNPACKNGIWLSEIFLRLMKGLKKWEPDHQKRENHIFNNMIHGFVYSKIGLYLTKKTLYGNKNAVGNVKLIEFWKEDINMKFDIIVGNPPYQASNIKSNCGGRPTLWDKFVEKSLLFLEKNGYLCFIHPRLWRRPDNKMWKMLSSKQIHYLEIHNMADGKKLFNVFTSYDWYILKNCDIYKKTIIIDEIGKENFIDMRDWNFLPNFDYKNNFKILGNGFNIICSCFYSIYGNCNYVSKIKSEKYKYPLIHSINQNGIQFYYSSRKDGGYFRTPKIIISDNINIYDIVIDVEGKFGLTTNTIAIPVKNLEEAQDIKKALLSQKFKVFLQTVIWTSFHRINRRMFKYFKKDWWKEFIDEI